MSTEEPTHLKLPKFLTERIIEGKKELHFIYIEGTDVREEWNDFLTYLEKITGYDFQRS